MSIKNASITVPLVLLVTGFCFALCVTPLSSMDIWWHLRTGAEILRIGELPESDWYTYTDGGRPWIDLHWGFQLLVHGLYELGGTDLLILAKAALTTAAVLITWRAGRGAFFPLAALVMALVAIVVSGQAIVRPKMLTLVFLALFLLVCRRGEEQPRAMLALVPFQILWTNVQGLFVLGPIVVACWLADRVMHRALGGNSSSAGALKSGLRFDVGVLVAVALACLVNPYGVDGALFPMELWKKFTLDREIYSIVLAFQRPVDFINDNGWERAYMFFQAALFGLGVLSFAPALSKGRFHPFRALLFASFSLLAWLAIRNADLFAIVTGFVVLGNLVESRATRTKDREGVFSALAAPAAILVLVGLCISIPTGALFSFAGDGRRLGLGERVDWYMHEPVKFASSPSMPAGAFVRHNGQAAVYIHAAGPGRKVFMDSRLEVATKATLSSFHEISRLMAASDEGFEDLIRMPNGALPAVILDSQFSRDQINGMLNLRANWRLVFQDKTGVVFIDEESAERAGLPDLFN